MWFHPLSRIDCGGYYRLRPRSTYFRPCAMGGGVNGCHGLLSAANPKKHHYCFLSMISPRSPRLFPPQLWGFPVGGMSNHIIATAHRGRRGRQWVGEAYWDRQALCLKNECLPHLSPPFPTLSPPFPTLFPTLSPTLVTACGTRRRASCALYGMRASSSASW